MEDIGPGDLPQHRVSHCHIEPVVSARVRDLRTWVDNLSSTKGRWGVKIGCFGPNSAIFLWDIFAQIYLFKHI